MHVNMETYGTAYEKLRLSISTLVLGSVDTNMVRRLVFIFVHTYFLYNPLGASSMHHEYVTPKFT